MPYIPVQDREGAEDMFGEPGDFAYKLTVIILEHLGQVVPWGNADNWDDVKKKLKYKDYAMAIGVLESVKLELYRRMVAPYEDQKIEDNTDVY